MTQLRESKLLVYLIIALGLVLGFLYGNSLDPAVNTPQLDGKYLPVTLQALRSARIDESLLSSEVFKSLRIFGSLPVVPATGGTTNPF